jgi:hypothetical protein
MGRPPTSTISSATSSRNAGGIGVRTALRCCPGLAAEFSKWIEADRGSEVFASAPANANSARSDVRRLVL